MNDVRVSFVPLNVLCCKSLALEENRRRSRDASHHRWIFSLDYLQNSFFLFNTFIFAWVNWWGGCPSFLAAPEQRIYFWTKRRSASRSLKSCKKFKRRFCEQRNLMLWYLKLKSSQITCLFTVVPNESLKDSPLSLFVFVLTRKIDAISDRAALVTKFDNKYFFFFTSSL